MTPEDVDRDMTAAAGLSGPVTWKVDPTPAELDMAVTGELRAIRCWLVFIALCAMIGATEIGFIAWMLMRAFYSLSMGGSP